VNYARVDEEQVLVLRWGVTCPEHGEIAWGLRDRQEAEDSRFAHNVGYHPASQEARWSERFPHEETP
jgi:hypothetical protein